SDHSRVQLRNTDTGSVLSVDYHAGKDDAQSVLRSHALLDKWLRQNGLGKLEYLHDEAGREQAVLDQALDGYHQIGLARMSTSSSQGIVDGNCKAHDIANLYLAGASVFATGSQANPTLPAVALALRLGDHLAELVR